MVLSSLTGLNTADLVATQQRTPSLPAPGSATGAGDADYAATRQAARKFVNETFFGTLMREMRKSANTDHELNGGRGEEIMGPELDQALVDRMSKAQNFKLTDSVADQLYRHTHRGLSARSQNRINGGGA